MKRPIILAVVVVLLAATATVAVWKSYGSRAVPVYNEAEILKGLNEEEIQILLESQSLAEPTRTLEIVDSVASRRTFLRGMREFLALAAQARREGLANDENFKRNFELKQSGLLANLYQTKLSLDEKKRFAPSKEQIEALWANPESEKRFQADLQATQAIQKTVSDATGSPYSPVKGDVLNKSRESWATTILMAEMARKDTEYMRAQQRALALRFKVLEAGILASACLTKHWAESMAVSDKEVADYIAAHAEYDVTKKQALAQQLLERVMHGEDIAKLATEFSEDRSTKKSGGLYDEGLAGGLWTEVKQAALALKDGEIANRLIESKDGYHIVKLISRRTATEDGVESVKINVRHILIQRKFEDPTPRNSDIPAPFMTAEEIAKTALKKEKRQHFVDATVAREAISLPDDFRFELTGTLKAIRDDERQRAEQAARNAQGIKPGPVEPAIKQTKGTTNR